MRNRNPRPSRRQSTFAPSTQPAGVGGYRTADRAGKRRIQAAAVGLCRLQVAALARRTVPARHRKEAEQVGAIGILLALEKFDEASGISFKSLAQLYAGAEIARWIEAGTYWRKKGSRRTRKGGAK